MILHEIFRVVSRFPPLHFMLYRGKSISFGTVWLFMKGILVLFYKDVENVNTVKKSMDVIDKIV